MCGIFGYVGDGNASNIILKGLKRLEYRGYDSWGIALCIDNQIKLTKQIGAIGNVEMNDINLLKNANLGIGHTRWATHGGVTQINSHPHISADRTFAIAQNGIVENFQYLKKRLESDGYKFITETDTEVIVRLIEKYKQLNNNLYFAVREAFLKLDGRNTIVVLDTIGERIFAIRNGSPLVLGTNDKNKGIFIASDTLSFSDKARMVIPVEDGQMCIVRNQQIEISNIYSGDIIDYKSHILKSNKYSIDKKGYPYFMIKEIEEQSNTVKTSSRYTYDELIPLISSIMNSDTVYVVGAGSASFAAGQIAYFLRRYSMIKTIELKSYEAESYRDLFGKNDTVIAVSQSGETIDTIEILELAKSKGVKIACVVNMSESTIPQMSDYVYKLNAGPEICVASTKVVTSMITWGFLLSMSIVGKYSIAQRSVRYLGNLLEQYLTDELYLYIDSIAKKLINFEHFFILGKGQNYYIALEAALKIKEVTYKHFEGFSAGELKHGVISLVDTSTPVLAIISEDEYKLDIISSIAEVKARGAMTVAIGKQNNEYIDMFIKTPNADLLDSIVNLIPFQLLAYFMALRLGNNPDKPRNLAKSVTVK